MTKPILEELANFKIYSNTELKEMNILELAEKFKILNDEMEKTEDRIDGLMETYEFLCNTAEKYNLVYQKKEKEFTKGKAYFTHIPGKA